jgi:hypothetical protein
VQLNGGFSDRDAALATVRKWRDGYTFKHP